MLVLEDMLGGNQATSLHCQHYRLKSNHVHVGPGLPRAFVVVAMENEAGKNERSDCVGLCDASVNIM